MNTPKGSEVGAVAIHRWFGEGEGWAYHPSYESRMHEVLSALKEELDTRRELEATEGRRSFAYKAMGGILLGEQVRDSSCPDEKAADRYPTILRAVYLRDPEPHLQASLSSELARVEALKAGSDSRLKINLPDGATPTTRSRRFPGKWLLLASVLLATGVVGWVAWSQATFHSPKEQESELQSAAGKMEGMLKNWKAKDVDKLDRKSPTWPQEVAERFFRFLSQEVLAVEIAGDHPDAIFCRRFPKKGVRPKDLAGVRQGLEKLLSQLANGEAAPKDAESTPPVTKPVAQLLDEVAQQSDYFRWWTREGYRASYAQASRPEKSVSEFARRFVSERPVDRANRSWQQPTAEAMFDTLAKTWKVEAVAAEDASKRPWLVYHCFFQFLSQQQFQDDDLREDSWPLAFVHRLPVKALTADGVFTTEQALVEQLEKLAKKLKARESNNPATLIGYIAEKMDYDAWKKAEEAEFGSVRRGKVAPTVEQFVTRFRQKPAER